MFTASKSCLFCPLIPSYLGCPNPPNQPTLPFYLPPTNQLSQPHPLLLAAEATVQHLDLAPPSLRPVPRLELAWTPHHIAVNCHQPPRALCLVQLHLDYCLHLIKVRIRNTVSIYKCDDYVSESSWMCSVTVVRENGMANCVHVAVKIVMWKFDILKQYPHSQAFPLKFLE